MLASPARRNEIGLWSIISVVTRSTEQSRNHSSNLHDRTNLAATDSPTQEALVLLTSTNWFIRL